MRGPGRAARWHEECFPVTSMRAGESAVIAGLKTRDSRALHKLMMLGVVPGSELLLLQRFPSYVLQVGQTQVALDRETARLVQVRRKDLPPGRTGD